MGSENRGQPVFYVNLLFVLCDGTQKPLFPFTLPIAVISTMSRSSLCCKWFISAYRSHVSSREAKAGTGKEHCLLVCSQAQVQFQPKTTQPARRSCINYESRKCMIDMPMGQLDGGNSPTEVPSSQMYQADHQG